MAVFGKTADPRDIDLVLDKANFAHMGRLATDIGNPFLMELIALMTDMANIRIAIRGKLAGESRDFFRKAILPGGLIDPTRFRDASEKPLENLLEAIRFTWFGEAAIEGMEGYKAGHGISWLEKQLDDRLMVFVRKARYTAMGVEAMVGHLLARETEIRNVRIVMTGRSMASPNRTSRKGLGWPMYRVGVIGDKDSVLGFTAIGFEAFPVENAEQAEILLRDLAEKEFAVLYVTEQVAASLESVLALYGTDGSLPSSRFPAYGAGWALGWPASGGVSKRRLERISCSIMTRNEKVG